jgi:hypothetical protein
VKASRRWPIVKVRFWKLSSFSSFSSNLSVSPKGTDFLYLQLMGKDTIVLSSNEAISDLIDKRSSIYADRVSRENNLTFYTPDTAL